MNDAELNRLAELIASELVRTSITERASPARDENAWLPIPVRPEPPARSNEPAPWSGAGQALGDVAPIRSPSLSAYRDDARAATAAVRAAAAGHTSVTLPAPAGRVQHPLRRVRQRVVGQRVSVGVSNHHVHLSEEDALTLFGPEGIRPFRQLTQPGQFAAVQRVDVEGPAGKVPGVRVVGPCRSQTQLEISRSDALSLGVEPPVVVSGQLELSVGGVVLHGTHGKVSLARGVIVPSRHLHLAPADAARWGVANGDVVSVRCGSGAKEVTWHGVVVRSGPAHATEIHVDTDEARAAGLATGDVAQIVGVSPRNDRRRLYTERDVISAVKAGETIPAGALLTPSARDRAKMLGVKLA